MNWRTKFVASLRIIWAIAIKDILDALKNKTALSIMLGITILMLSGHALPLIMKLREIPTAVVYDTGRSGILRGLRAEEDHNLVIVNAPGEMEERVSGSVRVILGLSVPENFDQLAGSGELVVLDGFAAHWADPAQVNDLARFFEDELGGASWQNIRITAGGNSLYPIPGDRGFTYMISLVFVVIILTMGVALVPSLFVEEKESHTLDVLLVSPASYNQVIAGKAIAGVFYCLLASLVIMLFDHHWFVHWGLAVAVILLGSTFAVLLGLLVGTIIEDSSGIGMWAGLAMGTLIMPVFLRTFVLH